MICDGASSCGGRVMCPSAGSAPWGAGAQELLARPSCLRKIRYLGFDESPRTEGGRGDSARGLRTRGDPAWFMGPTRCGCSVRARIGEFDDLVYLLVYLICLFFILYYYFPVFVFVLFVVRYVPVFYVKMPQKPSQSLASLPAPSLIVMDKRKAAAPNKGNLITVASK